MNTFRRKKMKKAIAFATGAALFFESSLIGTQTVFAETVQDYNSVKATEYAAEHFDDSKTSITSKPDCIQFVRECLEAGGIPKDDSRNYGYTVESYKEYLLNNGYAQLYKLDTEKQEWTNPQWYVRASENEGRLSVGDGIIYFCNDCDRFFHSSICNAVDEDGFARYYAQNVAVDNKPICQIDHSSCGKNRQNVSIYALHITSKINGYTDTYDNATISGLKVLRTGVTNLTVTWDELDLAKGYKVFVKNGQSSVFNQIADVNGTSISFEEPEQNANYYFAVRPYFEEDGKNYVGKLSDIVKNDEEEATTKLAAPESVTAKLVNGTIKLAWNKVAGADKYEVWRSSNGVKGTYFLIYSGTWKGCTNSSVNKGTTYYYKVRAIDNENEEFTSDYSGIVSATYKLSCPTTKITIDAPTGKPKISWNKVSVASKYTLYRATSKNGKYSKLKTTTKNTYIDSSAVVGKKYYYKVVAVHNNNAANSAYSNIVSAICDLKRPVVKTSSPSTKKIKLTWIKITGTKCYAVYRATSKNGTYKKITTVNGTSYINKSLKKGKTYYYKVRALHKNADANSAYSLVVTQKCK